MGFNDPVLDDVLKAEAGETERRGVEADFGLSTDLKEPFVSEGVRVPDGIEEAEERRAVLAVGTDKILLCGVFAVYAAMENETVGMDHDFIVGLGPY
ncbi:hypothetical protein ACLKA6_002148 [Drosophila palustris]